MLFTKIKHYSKKCWELGPIQTAQIVNHRLKAVAFQSYLRYKAQHKHAHHTWDVITHNHDLDKDFQQFFLQLQRRSLACLHTLYADQQNNKTYILNQADQWVRNCFDILGSGQLCFSNIPWHTDSRLQTHDKQENCHFNATAFYKDIPICVGDNESLAKDIKVPWELARFQHLLLLGQAYSINGDERYAQTFVDHVTDWLDHNPFLLGPNWVCPMEVGIRAVNWIWAFYFFKDVPSISLDFWERFVCSLYDHMIYLENNWELYDLRTSNHYLSDLIGYFYLCFFFQDMPGITAKRDWCYQELLKEFDKQVFEEGTDYEGSTCYHRLVTELFYHTYLLCQEYALPLPHYFVKKLKRMFTFIDWCTPHNGALVQIGDNDSGTLLFYGLTSTIINDMKLHDTNNAAHFPAFGISIIKTDRWHITMRHHAYRRRQPSGHFHNDVGSVTLAIDGIPILVDPGSFIYTPSRVWRNRFRSASMHNTLFFLMLSCITQTSSSSFYSTVTDLAKLRGLSISRPSSLAI